MVRYSLSCMNSFIHYFTPVYPDAIQVDLAPPLADRFHLRIAPSITAGSRVAPGISPRGAHRFGREPSRFIRLVPPNEGCRLPPRPVGSSRFRLTYRSRRR